MSSFLSKSIIYRVAGFGYQTIEQLRFNLLFEQIYRLHNLSLALEECKEPICDELYRLCADLPDNKMQNTLLKVKRNIFNYRPIIIDDALQKLLDYLPGELREKLEWWCDTIACLKQGEAVLQDLFDTELDEKRKKLGVVFKDSDLQSAVLLSSQKSYEGLVRYIEKSSDGELRGIRQSEMSLFTYLARMTMKTSPFSAFTQLMVGEVSDQSNSSAMEIQDLIKGKPLKRVSFLNHQIITGLISLLCKNQRVRSALTLKVNPSVRLIDGTIKYITPREGWTQEQMVRIPMNPLLKVLIEQADVTRTYGEWVSLFAQTFEEDMMEVIGLLEKLIQYQMISISIPVPERSPNFGRAVSAFCRQLNDATLSQFADLLDHILDLVEGYAHLVVSEQRKNQLAEILARVQEAVVFLAGDDAPPVQTFGLVYEDVGLTQEEPIAISAEELEPLLPAMDEVQRLGSLFNIHEPFRILAARLLTDQYPDGCEDIQDFYDCFRRYVEDNHLVHQQNDPDTSWWKSWTHLLSLTSIEVPELRVIKQLQQEVVAYLQERISNSTNRLTLTLDEINTFTQRASKVVETSASVSLFAQPTGRKWQDGLIINKMAQGFGMAFTRFEQFFFNSDGKNLLFPAMKETAAYYMKEHDVKLVDMGGVFRSNLNLHSGYLPYQLVTSYNLHVPTEMAVHLQDIRVKLDPETRRIRFVDKRDGKELLFVHTGLMSWFLLPPFYRFLIQMTTEAQPMFAFVERMEEVLPEEKREQIRHYPRISLEKITLERETWVIPITKVPVRHSKDLPLAYLMRINEWRESVGLPERCFYTIQTGGSDRINFEDRGNAPQLADVLTKWKKSRKPQYLDFHNPYSVLQFEKDCKNDVVAVQLTELLPFGAGDERAYELLLEWNRGAGGDTHHDQNIDEHMVECPSLS